MRVYSSLTLVMFLLHVSQATSITLSTRLGNITGISNNLDGFTVHKFLGIPYAQAPLGNLRFSKPVARNTRFPAEGFNATRLPAFCPQPFNGAVIGEENCLNLNIHTPSSNESGLKPVMIWIHGGGFRVGAATAYPQDMLASFGDVVIVTINYRLGIFGFLTTGKSDLPGNYGLFDQKLAIEWVKENIEDYAGDPNQITIFGESAGGRSVSFQAFSPLNDASLFQKVIIESGSALSFTYLNRDPLDVTNPVILAAGCKIDSHDLISCLRGKSTEELLTAASQAKRPFAWFPIVDGDFLPYDLGYLYGNFTVNGVTDDLKTKCGNLAQYELMGGWNDQDGLYYVSSILSRFTANLTAGITNDELRNALQFYPFYARPEGNKTNPLSDVYRLFYQTNPRPGIAFNRSLPLQRLEWFYDIAGDVVLKLPVLMNVKLHRAISSKPSYGYEFIHRRSWKSPLGYKGPDWLRVGADHTDEIPFVLGWPLLANVMRANRDIDMPEMAIYYVRNALTHNYTDDEIQLATYMMTSWINFLKTGSPNTTLPNRQWSEYSLIDGQRVAVINTRETSMLEYPLRERLQLFEAMSAADQRATDDRKPCSTINNGLISFEPNILWLVSAAAILLSIFIYRY